MRDYARISSRFWTGPTGKAIRKLGAEAQVVACYLISAPGSNMIGLYYLPLPTLCHETGIPFEGASKALRSLQALEFAFYDHDTEVVWLPEMAEHQIAPTLKPEDNRVKSICRELATYIDSRFYSAFVQRYGKSFSLPDNLPAGSPFEAPSKPLRSQEQEQEQVTGTDAGKRTLFEGSAAPPLASAAGSAESVEVWIPFEGTQPPATAKHGPWRSGTNGAHWEYGVTKELLERLRGLYPGVQVDTETRRFADWCERNPHKRKTYGKRCGVLEALHFWLDKRQNGGRGNGGGSGQLGAFGVTSGVLLAERRDLGRSPELDAEIEEDRRRLMANRAEEDARRAAVS